MATRHARNVKINDVAVQVMDVLRSCGWLYKDIGSVFDLDKSTIEKAVERRAHKDVPFAKPHGDFIAMFARGEVHRQLLLSSGLRKCTKCGTIKTLAEFSPGNTCWCKRCTANYAAMRVSNSSIVKERKLSYTRAWRARRPERVKELGVLRARKRKKECFEQYGGCACACCGVTELAFLTLDHVYNDGAEHRRKIGMRVTPTGQIGFSGGTFYDFLKKQGYPDKERYQVLCWNCQWGKRLHGTCPHQNKVSLTLIS